MKALIILGVLLVVAVVLTGCSSDTALDETGDGSAPSVGDHWHAYLGVDVCDTWLPNGATFEQRANDPGERAGLHFHGDGIMHFHPFSTDEAGKNATVGRLLDYGGWSLSKDSMKLWDGVRHNRTTPCKAGSGSTPATIQWKVGRAGQAWPTATRTGDPSRYRPRNADIVAVYFLPKGAPLPEPPMAEQAMSSISDLGGASSYQKPNGNFG